VSRALEASGRLDEAPPEGDLVIVTHLHGAKSC
jgi:hypothetical protein